MVTMKENKITAEALRFWMKKNTLTQAALSEKAGLAQNYISQIVTGMRKPSIEAVEQLCEAMGISLPEFFARKDDDMPEVEFVPLVKAVPRAGTGGLETDGDFDRWYSFHSSFLARKGGSKESMRLFRVDGDSMEPTLFSGDMIMVNLKTTHITTGGIYLLRLEDELMVKRLENRLGGILLIRSDNEAYEDISINKTEVDGDIEIFGRMVWSCREY